MGIAVVDLLRDDWLNTRFGHHFGENVPPTVIVNCSTSINGLINHYGTMSKIDPTALYHAMHQAWFGVAKYLKVDEFPKLPEYALVHVDGVIEFAMACRNWAWVYDKELFEGRVIFNLYPLTRSDPMTKLVGEDISSEIWKKQRLPPSHSAILLNYP